MDNEAAINELRRQRDEALQVQTLQQQLLQKIRALADEALGVNAVAANAATALSSVTALHESYDIVARGVVPQMEMLEREMRTTLHPSPETVTRWADQIAVLRRWPPKWVEGEPEGKSMSDEHAT